MDRKITRTLGANLNPDGSCTFRVWAPFAEQMQIKLGVMPEEMACLNMHKGSDDYYELTVPNIKEGTRYYYYFANKLLPDLASDYQPEGILGPTEIISKRKFEPWKVIALADYIIYELHVGTFSAEGTFAGIIPYLPELKALGITAIELMPIAQFPGGRNWGYDGVLPFAVQNTYGGPQALKQLVDACHELELAVILDVVYNHLGPEGNFFTEFGPYLTDKYLTPWGKTLNFDDYYSHHVRRYFIENALHWFSEYGIDALRLDALHAIVDTSAYPFLEELADRVSELSEALGQQFYLIAESSANDPRLIRTKDDYGFGLHAQWNDDFHHALHTLLTKEQDTYYQDYGDIKHFLKAYKEGYVYTGEYSPFRKQPHGVSAQLIPAERFVVFMQNHDHIGNRPTGDRLTQLLSPAQLRFGAALLFFAPYIPLIFMGEEYGEVAPFQYFISHTDEQLIEAVRRGRRDEFSFREDVVVPDPYDERTYQSSKLNHALKKENEHQLMWRYYQSLMQIRRSHPALCELNKNNLSFDLFNNDKLWLIKRTNRQHELLLVANFSPEMLDYKEYLNTQDLTLLLDSYDYEPVKQENEQVHAHLQPFGVLLFERITESD
ncbi:Malto-oligosyltrehalose trehalohydrolase [Legionella beliardensis]|uniref:Malto-oligosyltrehalose trehalohydrolase n=1 Tax=Legionella beliardensis TaxID=91822 RepID=A0A378HY76_9GAMM|nr:malto-oligosyltrehalose trehalohydrolase [Legionella beliardensis]STX27857.1 Malto-oligosyltrehalose trehalohydrolase [Legionella beliardensis]